MTHIYFTQEICSGKPYPTETTKLEPHIVLIILTKQFNTKSMLTNKNIYEHFPSSIDYWKRMKTYMTLGTLFVYVKLHKCFDIHWESKWSQQGKV